MNWGLEDLLAAIAIVAAVSIALTFVFRYSVSRRVQLMLAFAVMATALVIWAHLAVGIF